MVGKIYEVNTMKRNQAETDFGRNFYNILSNSFYGKTMESVRKRRKIEFI